MENELVSVVVSGQTTTFTYDAAGIRVKTIKPDGSIIDTPFPGYEVENPGLGNQTIRMTFSIAGQAVAMRVNNNIYHLYNDHLGSLGSIGTSISTLVNGSRTYYKPFGGYRGVAPTQTITDRDFTGQRENMELGLVYYGARFYVPGLGRFASADTIVPNPARPQSYNRYSYVGNRPLNFSDPTGHRECNIATGDCGSPESPNPIPSPAPSDPLPSIPTDPMVTFSGCETCTWTDEEMATIMQSANDTGAALAQTLNAAHGWNLSASDAFLLVYGGAVNFNKTGQSCLDATGSSGCWGSSTGRNNIDVYTDAGSQIAGDVHWAVHELGHSYVNAVGTFSVGGQEFTLPSLLEAVQGLNNGFPDRPPGSDRDSRWGFAGGRWEWQRSSSGLASEEFADMYLGWVYNQWEMEAGSLSVAGQYRSDFMNAVMPYTVDMAIGR